MKAKNEERRTKNEERRAKSGERRAESIDQVASIHAQDDGAEATGRKAALSGLDDLLFR
jgi:hypothetical protein